MLPLALLGSTFYPVLVHLMQLRFTSFAISGTCTHKSAPMLGAQRKGAPTESGRLKGCARVMICPDV